MYRSFLENRTSAMRSVGMNTAGYVALYGPALRLARLQLLNPIGFAIGSPKLQGHPHAVYILSEPDAARKTPPWPVARKMDRNASIVKRWEMRYSLEYVYRF